MSVYKLEEYELNPEAGISSLTVGRKVKLCFQRTEAFIPRGEPIAEAMWVEITNISGEYPHATYRGELVNTPVLFAPEVLRVGCPLTFKAEHIYEVYHEKV